MNFSYIIKKPYKITIFLSILVIIFPHVCESTERYIQVVPGKPSWFNYSDGSPFFLASPGDPENFLYRGTLREDGTRDGDQLRLINKLKNTGANGIYMQAVRSHGGDGDVSHNPFINNEPTLGLNEKVLNQWEKWFTEMDAHDIVIYLFFYDDSAKIWDTGDTVILEERYFFEAIVNRFEKFGNIIWVIAEEYAEAYTPARISALAKIIKEADDYNHPIAVHLNHGLNFSEFENDNNIDQFSIQYNRSRIFILHRAVRKAWKKADGRYNLNLAEAANWGQGEIARKKAWAVAMGGAYVMVFEMDIANTPISDLKDLGILRKFMEASDYYSKKPHDDLGYAATKYVLADPGTGYILYSADSRKKDFGLKKIVPGRYRLVWLDIINGRTLIQDSVSVNSDRVLWKIPEVMGSEVALYAMKIFE